MFQSKTPATRRFSPVKLFLLTLTGMFIGIPAAYAHHGTAVSYEQEKWITVTGTVTEFRWRNPHSALFLDIEDESGNVVNYAIELPSPVLMSRSIGWTRATFRPGDTVQFRVHPSRTGAPVGECLSNCEVLVNGETPGTIFDDQEEN